MIEPSGEMVMTKQRGVKSAVIVGALLGFAGPNVAAGMPMYSVTNLDFGIPSGARLNDQDQVVALVGNSVFLNGQLQPLPASFFPIDFNNQGQVLLGERGRPHEPGSYGVWSEGQVNVLQTLTFRNTTGLNPIDINDSGLVLGGVTILIQPPDSFHAFDEVWRSDGVPFDSVNCPGSFIDCIAIEISDNWQPPGFGGGGFTLTLGPGPLPFVGLCPVGNGVQFPFGPTELNNLGTLLAWISTAQG
jgi:hypothetical protein